KSARRDYLSELTVSFLRPWARRREITARPSAVFIRERKPCVLARWRLLGWNVRFGMVLQGSFGNFRKLSRKSDYTTGWKQPGGFALSPGTASVRARIKRNYLLP